MGSERSSLIWSYSRCPNGEQCDMKVADFAAKLKATSCSRANEDDESFSAQIGENLMVTMSDSFASAADLGLPFSDPRSASMPLNVPFGALRVHASISGDTVYDPDELLNGAVLRIG